VSSPGFARVWKKAYHVISVSDPRGIRSATTSTSGSLSRSAAEGPDQTFAIQEELGDYAARRAGETIAFGFRMQLAGTGSLHIAPVGDTTEIRMTSDWPHPSFSGGWSPDERTVAAQGFRATWRTTHLATGGQAVWSTLLRGDKGRLAQSAAGVSLFDPVNVYMLSYRAVEYGFLFILFTFAALALVETLSGLRLHPIQYALVGSAIAVFFLLLLALSEHIAFSTAYSCAAAACVLLITVYLRPALRSWARTLAMTALFGGLYAGLYVMLSSEDNALLLGSLMVFALLAVTMIATRKLDWSQFPFLTKSTIASTNGLATGNVGSE
jgi:inner membrane protein